MICTSAEAAKLLRTLNEEHEALKNREAKTQVFTAAVGEDIDSVRPEYDYGKVQERLAKIESKVRAVKHAINVFNTVTEVPGFSMTIDQMLVYIPQLTDRKRKLNDMALRLPKERNNSGYGAKTIIEYDYANYDPSAAEKDLAEVTDELSRAQTALDVVNNSATMEIDI